MKASEWFDLRTGVRQGCPLSPLLFNVYMDFIARQLVDECRRQQVQGFRVSFWIGGQEVDMPDDDELAALLLLYADDMMITATDRVELQCALHILEQIGIRWGMGLNYNKTFVVLFQHHTATATVPAIQPPIQLEPRQIEERDTVK